jgi:outer membrane receptor protein involved in Fe transport
LVTLANGSTITDTESYSQKEIQSVFFNGSVGYKSMVYLDVTGRNDWSSTLPANNRSYFYPSVSLSGILSEMFNLPSQISYLKVRGSWAKVGNDTDPYKLTNSYSLYTSADKVNSDVIKVKLSDTYPLYNLKPEETNSYETGLELQMFKGRLGLDFTYYNSNTVNQILSINMPQSSGYTAKNINAGKIKSSGYEVMLSGTPIKTKDWKWDINLNWGMNRTKCVKLDDEIKQYELGEIRIGKVVVNEGGSMGDIVSIAYKRDAKGNILIDDNGLPETQSDQVIGNMMPKWTGSINNNLQWKNLTFGALVDMRYGGDFISMTDNYACEFGNSTKTLTGRDGMVVSGVSASTGEANTVKTTAEKYYTSIAGPYGVGEAFMYKNTYIKLRELSLGYQLPSLWLKHIFIKSAKITAVARDLFYIYKSAPVNPEGAYTRSDYAQAFELGSTPPVRSFGFAVNLKF